MQHLDSQIVGKQRFLLRKGTASIPLSQPVRRRASVINSSLLPVFLCAGWFMACVVPAGASFCFYLDTHVFQISVQMDWRLFKTPQPVRVGFLCLLRQFLRRGAVVVYVY